MSRFIDPLKEYRDMLKVIRDPLKEHRDMMKAITNPLKEHRDMMKSITDPLKEHQAMMKAMADPLKEHRDMMKSITDPFKNHRAMMEAITNPLKEHRAIMDAMSEPLKQFRASIASIPNPLKDIRESIGNSNAFNILKNITNEVSSDLKVNANGTVSLSSSQISLTAINELSNQIIYKSSLAPSSSIDESINNLISEIRSQKDPLIQKILICFIYPLIIAIIASFISPVIDYHVKSYLSKNKRAIEKDLKAKVTVSIEDKEVLRVFRYISADVLNVRTSAAQKSKTIGHLRFGYAVIVKEKRKSWTLIEWNDPESGAEITGWVFSRYLKKFN